MSPHPLLLFLLLPLLLPFPGGLPVAPISITVRRTSDLLESFLVFLRISHEGDQDLHCGIHITGSVLQDRAHQQRLFASGLLHHNFLLLRLDKSDEKEDSSVWREGERGEVLKVPMTNQ